MKCGCGRWGDEGRGGWSLNGKSGPAGELIQKGIAYTFWLAIRALEHGRTVRFATVPAALGDCFAQQRHTVDVDADSWRDSYSINRLSPRKKK
jgi:hypothetical protein